MESDGSRPRRLTHIGYAADAVWSPDGKRIAYSRSPGRGEAGIYVVNADGSDDHALEGAQPGSNPAWSPDGHQIAFTSWRGGDNDIYVIDADGGDVRQLTQTGLNEWVKGWSKRGRILFEGFLPVEGELEPDAYLRIHVIDDDGSGEHRVSSTDQDVEDASWIPGEETIAYVVRTGRHGELHTVHWNGRGRRRVMDLPRGASEPDWHPAVSR
jgi:TolB protein